MSKKILSFGELLLRICPDAGGEWMREGQLPFYVGGAEANVATALALWGIPSAYCTALPDHSVAREVEAYLRSRGIDTSRIRWQGDRLGLYFLTKGKDLKNAGVIYDRNGSSFSELRPGTLDWDEILKDTARLHFSAISPALNAGVAAVCEEAVKAAAVKNIAISVDLNYRPKLWQYGKQPVEVMPALVKYCDLIMGNVWAAEKMLGIPIGNGIRAQGTDEGGREAGGNKGGKETGREISKEDYLEQARLTSQKILEQFPRARIVANTFRFDEDLAGIRYYTTLFAEGHLHVSEEYYAGSIVDKVGSGDCFMAGLLYGLYRRLPLPDTLEFATTAAFQKLFILSDATDQTVADIETGSNVYPNKR